MSERHVFRDAHRTPAESARLRTDRERYQRERPTPEQLLEEGGHADFLSLAEVLDLHEIGASLRRERERQQLTLAEVSAKTGIDAAAISRVENGQNGNPTFSTVL